MVKADCNGSPFAGWMIIGYTNQAVLDYVRKIKSKGGVFAYNVAPYQEGRISEATMEQLRWLKKNGIDK